MRPRISIPVSARSVAAWSCICALVGQTGTALAQAFPEQAERRTSEPTGNQGFYLHLGPGALLFDAGAKIREGGTEIPGATVSIDPNLTVVTELGYRGRNLGISLTGGLPPVARVKGAGSLASLGTLGRVRYGPAVLTLHYHFTQLGRFQPYIGAGPALLLVFQDKDGAVTRLNVKDRWGASIQLGAEYMMSRRWGLFVDAKKVFLTTRATALLDGAPIEAEIKLDPLVLSGGISFRF